MSYHLTVVLNWGTSGALRGHLIISEDVFGCAAEECYWHLRGSEARDVAEQGTRQPPQKRMIQSQI